MKFRKLVLPLAIILSVAIILGLSIWFARPKTDKTVTQINYIISIIGLVGTIWTVIIAVLLYDRFGLKGNVIERQADKVLELIEFLKASHLFAKSSSMGYQLYPRIRNLTDILAFAKSQKDLNKIPVINSDDYDIYSHKLNEFDKDYWLPQTIKLKIQFLIIMGTKEIELNKKEHVRLLFGNKEENWCRYWPEITFGKFISNYIDLLKAIDRWMKRNHSDLIILDLI